MAEFSITEVSVDRLTVDPEVQRGLRGARVTREVERYNPDGLGMITVSDRGLGNLVIIDGQHRVEFVRKAEGPTARVLCKIFTGLTKQEEASLFLVLNNMEVVKYLDQFHVRVTKKDPVAVYLKSLVEKHGWPLGPGPGKSHFLAVAALERIYNLDKESDPTAAERAVATLSKAWGHAEGVMDGRLVEGLGRVYARHKSAIDAGSMIERLAKDERGPAGFIGAARTLRSMRRGSVVDAMAELFTDVYNRYRKPKAQVPAWRA